MGRFSTSLLGEAKVLLLATDCSEFSDGAVQEAIFFGQACGARIIALHVVKTEAESLKAANSSLMQRRQELTPYFDRLQMMAADSGVNLEVIVIGSMAPAEAIIEQARTRQADVILMGRHGKSGRLALLVGSMTARVIGLGFPQVLVVPQDFIITGARVLLVLDESATGTLAADAALSLCRRCTTLQRLTALAIARRDSETAAAVALAEGFCRRVTESGMQTECEPLIKVGSPLELIIQMAGERQVDMVMLGGRDKKSLTDRFLGHLAENVIGTVHCAVLVVNS